jgi:hypothetical protein
VGNVSGLPDAAPPGVSTRGQRGIANVERCMMTNRLPSVHPGEVLLEDFMKPLGLTQYRVVITGW